MDDIEEIIAASKHFKFYEQNSSTPFNPISSIPESKKHLKMAIKDRIQLLIATYISLASFIDDDLVEFLVKNKSTKNKEKIKRISNIYKKVLKDMEKFREEVKSGLM